MIEPNHPMLSIRRQCAVLGLPRASYYYAPVPESPLNLRLMRLIDEQYMRTPFYGWPKMTAWLNQQGYAVNHKRVQRLMQVMGLHAIQPRGHTTRPAPGHRIYPYLLRDLAITHPQQVWSADITYLPLRQGFLYLVAVIDWYSRYVLGWQLSNTLDGQFCCDVVRETLRLGQPKIFNTDQGVQFTAEAFTQQLSDAGIAISMDGRGRALDNVFIERLWRSLKYEDIYLKDYASVSELEHGLTRYFRFYNHERLHQSLDYRTPAMVHYA